MIKITYNEGCRLGNRLYMYAAGRLLARKLGYTLQSEPLEGFPRTQDILNGKTINPTKKLNGNPTLNINELQGHGHEIEYGFIHYRYFINDRELIKTWFYKNPPIQVDPNDVLINIRLREFCTLGLALDPNYYIYILDRITYKKLYLMTDDPRNPYLNFLKKYNPIPITGHGSEHFFKALAFNRIIMSNSTFCWWFTFVSSAKEIYLPIINGNRMGSWNLADLSHIDLRLDWPEVTHVYNISNWGNPCPGPTEQEKVEALAFGKYSKTMFLP